MLPAGTSVRCHFSFVLSKSQATATFFFNYYLYTQLLSCTLHSIEEWLPAMLVIWSLVHDVEEGDAIRQGTRLGYREGGGSQSGSVWTTVVFFSLPRGPVPPFPPSINLPKPFSNVTGARRLYWARFISYWRRISSPWRLAEREAIIKHTLSRWFC